MPELSSFSIPQDVLHLMMRSCFNHTVSLFWGEPDSQTDMRNGSGVLLELDRPLLVTASHVISEFLQWQTSQPSIKLQIGKGSIDNIAERIIGKANQPDLVTLDLTGIDVQRFARHLTFYAPAKWPPPPVIPGLSVLIVGFPKVYRETLTEQGAIKFNSFNLKTQVTSVSESNFVCAVDIQDMRNPSPQAIWPGAYGGISGCPIFAIRGSPSTFDLVGIAYEAGNDWHVLWAHHANFISSDGTLIGL